MAHLGGVARIDAKVTPVFSNSEPARRHCKAENGFVRKCRMCLQDYLNPINLGGVVPELLFNKFLLVLCTTKCLRVKGRESDRMK
jgi:hypothetical protein